MHHTLLSHTFLVSIVLKFSLCPIKSILEVKIFTPVNAKLLAQSLCLLRKEVKILPRVLSFSDCMVSLTIGLILLITGLFQMVLGFWELGFQLGYCFHGRLVLLIQLHESVFVFLLLTLHLPRNSFKPVHFHVLTANLFWQYSDLIAFFCQNCGETLFFLAESINYCFVDGTGGLVSELVFLVNNDWSWFFLAGWVFASLSATFSYVVWSWARSRLLIW